MSTGLENYDGWKSDDRSPVEKPSDPHEACERDIARLEAECEAAKQATARTLSFAELHGLVSTLIGDHSYAVTVQRWHHLGGRCEMVWRVSWFPDDENPRHCCSVEAASAAEAYAKLRAQVASPPNPLDEVGDLPW